MSENGGKVFIIVVLSLLLCVCAAVIAFLAVRTVRATTIPTGNSTYTDTLTGGHRMPTSGDYYGLPLGSLSELAHGVSGKVYIVDERRIFIKDLTYDGTAPLAYFWIGLKNSSNDYPDQTGRATADEKGSLERLQRSYKKEDVLLTLSHNITVRDIKWFGLWCVRFTMNFGHVSVPQSNLDVPAPVSMGEFYVHNVSQSGPVTAVDHKTVLVERFAFDSRLDDVYFIAGNGSSPSLASSTIRIPRLVGGLNPLDHKNLADVTVTLVFPQEFSLFNVDFIAIFSESVPSTYDMIKLPRYINVPPHFPSQ